MVIPVPEAIRDDLKLVVFPAEIEIRRRRYSVVIVEETSAPTLLLDELMEGAASRWPMPVRVATYVLNYAEKFDLR